MNVMLCWMCFFLSVFPDPVQLQYWVQVTADWYPVTEQPRGTVPSAQLHVSRKLQVCLTSKLSIP